MRQPQPLPGAPAAALPTRWYRGAIVWGRCRAVSVARRARRTRRSAALALAATAFPALLASGCGSAARLDAKEPSGTYHLDVVKAAFPSRQAIARPTAFVLAVRNAGSATAPNVAVTLDSFYYTERYPELAANKRPIWVVERGPGQRARPPVQTQEISQPGGAQTVYVNTWALGPLAAGATSIFIWHVVPVKAGVWTVHYRVAAGLAGKSVAVLPSGGPVHGQLTASVAPLPPNTHVDPATGRVVPGTYPLIP